MPTDKPIRKSMARVEFFACLETVSALLQKGFSKQLIYEQLKQEKRISMAYATFSRLISSSARDALRFTSLHPPSPKKSPSLAGKTASPVAGPRHVSASDDSFPDPRNMSAEDAI